MIAKSYPFGMKNDHIRMLFLLINMRTYMFMVISSLDMIQEDKYNAR